MDKKAILFNPVGAVHDRNIGIFEKNLPAWRVRCIYNVRHQWFSGKNRDVKDGACYFRNGHLPKEALDDVKAVILFSAQPRAPHLTIVQEAAFHQIPVIAIEEVFQMALEQGFVNEYFLPVDRLFVGSEYEKKKFTKIGVPPEAIETTGCVFRYKQMASFGMNERRDFKEKLGLSADKKVATLSLAYLTPSGETPEIRKRLLSRAAKELPEEYQLVVKPHPAETDKDIEAFIERYAPAATVVDRYAPIDKVLDITDLLINRGNSQVVVDALQRGIPVAVLPLGRRTIFHESGLDEAIIDGRFKLGDVLNRIKEKGMGLYGPIFRDHLALDPKEALERATACIVQIAEDGVLRDPHGRLIEIALFWAWTGYPGEALNTLFRIRSLVIDNRLLESVYNLVCRKAERQDISLLRDWSGRGTYKEWVLQSLWLNELYTRGRRMNSDDTDWLSDYPPRMNRESFLTHAYMLFWCYLRSGFTREASRLLSGLRDEYGTLRDVKRLGNPENAISSNVAGPLFWDMRIRHLAKQIFKNLAWKFS
jgi:hypothetical protein